MRRHSSQGEPDQPKTPEALTDKSLTGDGLLPKAETSGICILDPAGHAVHTSGSFARILGYENREIGRDRAGFVAVVGLPNAGKSTLVNALVGEKVSAVSPTPQTTRTLIRGILTEPRGQMVFLDTPGFHTAGPLLNQRMGGSLREAVEESHVILWVADMSSTRTAHWWGTSW